MARTTKFKGKDLPLVGPELKAGDKAPDFKCVTPGLEPVGLAHTQGKVTLFSVVPSLDTPVCSDQTKRFEQGIGELKDRAACYTVSLDLPFAQKRFCTENNISTMQTLSDVHNQSFGQGWGVLIEGLPIKLLSRAIFVVDKNGKISYAEYVPEVTDHPNYDKALAALKTAASA